MVSGMVSENLVLNEGYSSPNIIINISYSCYLEDVNHNRYIDTTLGNGTHILGHSPSVITETINKQLEKGILYTTYNENTYRAAELIRRCSPSVVDSVVFCNSGSEATMRAARISRAYTKKNKIAIFSGAWHGGNELFMYDHDYSSNQYTSEHKSAGVPDCFKEMVIVLPYNNKEAFNIIEENRDELAMVIVEPAQGSNPRDDMLGFLTTLRELTSLHNIVLCFDEIITGFRVALGGCSQFYGINPDLVTYGKTIGAGLPVGVVAGSKNIMGVVRQNNSNLPVFMGGTFSANPLVMSVVISLLEYLENNQDDVYRRLNDNGNYIKKTINKFCIDNDISIRVIGIGSMFRIVFTDYNILSRKDRDLYENNISIQQKFYNDLLFNKHIFVNGNRIMFLSTEHSKNIIDNVISAIIDSIKRFFC